MKTRCDGFQAKTRSALTGFVVLLVTAIFSLTGCSVQGPDIYTVSIGELENGTITANPAAGPTGTVITLTVNHDDGYRLKPGSLVYSTASNNAVPINEQTRKFNLPAENVTVTAQFEVLPAGTYAVDIGMLTNGTITANPTSGTAGTEITLTVNPDNGYRLKPGSLKYGTTPINETTKKFNLPAESVTVTAQFEVIGGTNNSIFTGQGLYIAGEYKDSQNVYKACYWKVDGTEITKQDLPAGTYHSSARAIAYDAGKLYIAGNYTTGGKSTPCYWIDDGTAITKYDLTKPSDAEPSWDVNVEAIAAFNGEVYVAGSYYTAPYFYSEKAVYWDKTGNLKPLMPDADLSSVNDIDIDQSGTVFISGRYYDEITVISENSYSGTSIGCFWKISGTTKTTVVLDNYLESVDGIAISSGTVYIVGRSTYVAGTSVPNQPHYISFPTSDEQNIGKYPLVQINPFLLQKMIRGITVKNGSVYAGGQYQDTTQNNLWYWDPFGTVNEKRIPLSISGDMYVTGIAVDNDGSVILSGNHGVNYEFTACFWKDGVLTNLMPNNTGSTGAIIFVE